MKRLTELSLLMKRLTERAVSLSLSLYLSLFPSLSLTQMMKRLTKKLGPIRNYPAGHPESTFVPVKFGTSEIRPPPLPHILTLFFSGGVASFELKFRGGGKTRSPKLET